MITKEFIIAAHSRLIALFGGVDGILDESLLESTVARQQNINAYNPKATVFEISASLTYGLIKNHCFIDGNKRIAALMCEMIIIKSGYEIAASEEEKYIIFINLAEGKLSEKELAIWLETNCKLIK